MGVAARPPDEARRVAFVFTLEDFVGIRPECFGATVTTRIGGREALITLPRFRWAGDYYVATPPKILGLAPDINWETRIARDKGPAWGGVGSWTTQPRRRPLGAGIQHMLVEVTVPSRWPYRRVSRLMEKIDEERSPWWVRFKDWVEVVTHQDLDRDRDALALGGPEAWFWNGQTARHVDRLHRATLRLPGGQMKLLSRRELARIGELVGIEALPPPVHLLLRDSRHALHDDKFRIAVLDAATSGELALHHLLEDRLRSVDPQVSEAVRATGKGNGAARAVAEDARRSCLGSTTARSDRLTKRRDPRWQGAGACRGQGRSRLGV